MRTIWQSRVFNERDIVRRYVRVEHLERDALGVVSINYRHFDVNRHGATIREFDTDGAGLDAFVKELAVDRYGHAFACIAIKADGTRETRPIERGIMGL